MTPLTVDEMELILKNLGTKATGGMRDAAVALIEQRFSPGSTP